MAESYQCFHSAYFSHLDAHCFFPASLAQAAVVDGPQGLGLIDSEFLIEGERLDVLPALFQHFFTVYVGLSCQANCKS